MFELRKIGSLCVSKDLYGVAHIFNVTRLKPNVEQVKLVVLDPQERPIESLDLERGRVLVFALHRPSEDNPVVGPFDAIGRCRETKASPRPDHLTVVEI